MLMSRAKMELIPSSMTTRTRLLEELRKRMLTIRKEGVSALRRHRVVRVFAIVEPLTQL